VDDSHGLGAKRKDPQAVFPEMAVEPSEVE
jgi:hypothetical protein